MVFEQRGRVEKSRPISVVFVSISTEILFTCRKEKNKKKMKKKKGQVKGVDECGTLS